MWQTGPLTHRKLTNSKKVWPMSASGGWPGFNTFCRCILPTFSCRKTSFLQLPVAKLCFQLSLHPIFPSLFSLRSFGSSDHYLHQALGVREEVALKKKRTADTSALALSNRLILSENSRLTHSQMTNFLRFQTPKSLQMTMSDMI